MAEINEIMQLQKEWSKFLLKLANVVGLGIGYKETAGKPTQKLSLIVMVQNKVQKAQLLLKQIIPEFVTGIPVDVLQVGKITAYHSARDRIRPVHPGMSIGHYAVHAGTFGVLVYDAFTGAPLILSNNHILANGNDAILGDPVLQPGPADGGKPANDCVAKLHRFVHLKYTNSSTGLENDEKCKIAQAITAPLNKIAGWLGSQTRLVPIKVRPENYIDAALALPDDAGIFTNEILNLGPVNNFAKAEIGMPVKKYGRTTGFTKGRVKMINADIEVAYSGQRTVFFKEQIITTDMSDPGDSGALLMDNDNRALGLCCGGSSVVSVFNSIENIMRFLNIRFNK